MGIIVVSGLSSGVGKTTATAAMTHMLSASGCSVLPVKFDTAGPDSSEDIATIARLTGVEGKVLAMDADPISALQKLDVPNTTVIVEGSGTISAPLLGWKTIADIAAELEAHLFVISGLAKGSVNLAVQAVRFARICGAEVEGMFGGALQPGAGLQQRLVLMEASKETGVPFWGNLPAQVDAMTPKEFGIAVERMMLPERWRRFIAQFS